jgi:hypothetical protein
MNEHRSKKPVLGMKAFVQPAHGTSEPDAATLRSSRDDIRVLSSILNHDIITLSQGFEIPPSHQIVVTTTQGVYTWSRGGVAEVFRSGSEGILAAKTTNGYTLAIADSQLVLLHDISKGMQQSYRLKGRQVSLDKVEALITW